MVVPIGSTALLYYQAHKPFDLRLTEPAPVSLACGHLGGPTTKLREPVPPGRGWQSQHCPVLILRRISLSARSHCILPVTHHFCHNPAPGSMREDSSVSRTAFTYKACSLSGLNSYGNVRYSWAVGLGGS